MPLSNVVFPSLSKRHGGFRIGHGNDRRTLRLRIRRKGSAGALLPAGAGPIVVAAPEVTNPVFWKISSGAVVLICGMRIEYL